MEAIELHEEALESLRDSVEDAAEEDGNVAVVGQPWGGRNELASAVAEEHDAEVERLSHDAPASIDLPDSDVAVLDCHHLYTREVDGFDGVESLLREAATSPHTVVTTWNTYSWRYLRHATDVDVAFDRVVEVPDLDEETARELVVDEYDVEDPEAELERHEELLVPEDAGFLGRLEAKARAAYRGSPVLTPMEALVQDAHGNPEVLRRLFEGRTARSDPVDRPSLDVGYSTSYALWLVASDEEVAVDRVHDVVGASAEAVLDNLVRSGAIEVEDGVVRPRVETYPAVVRHLSSRRLAW